MKLKIIINQKSFLNFIRLTSICEQTVSLKVSIMLSTPVGLALNLFEVITLPEGPSKLNENWTLPATGSARRLIA